MNPLLAPVLQSRMDVRSPEYAENRADICAISVAMVIHSAGLNQFRHRLEAEL